MRCSVKLLTAGVLVLSAGSFSTSAQAGEVCFKLDPFIDYLKLWFDPVKAKHQNVYGNWIAPGVYTLPVSGAFELDLGSTTVKRLGIIGTLAANADTTDNLICGLDGKRNLGWELNCTGGSGGNSQNSGTLSPVPCAGLAPSSARVTGRAAIAKSK